LCLTQPVIDVINVNVAALVKSRNCSGNWERSFFFQFILTLDKALKYKAKLYWICIPLYRNNDKIEDLIEVISVFFDIEKHFLLISDFNQTEQLFVNKTSVKVRKPRTLTGENSWKGHCSTVSYFLTFSNIRVNLITSRV
jgi:hypothetical protein